MTTRETAELLGVSTFTIRRAVKHGVLDPVRLGERGYLRFRRRDLEALIASGAGTPLEVDPEELGWR